MTRGDNDETKRRSSRESQPMNETQSEYLSYLLRVWRADPGNLSGWRASLEDPHTGERLGFASLEQLFAFLMEQTERAGPDVGRRTGDGGGRTEDGGRY